MSQKRGRSSPIDKIGDSDADHGCKELDFNRSREVLSIINSLETRNTDVSGHADFVAAEIVKPCSEGLRSYHSGGDSGINVEPALRALLSEKATLSASTVTRTNAKSFGESDDWSKRSLVDIDVVYLWADGIFLGAGPVRHKQWKYNAASDPTRREYVRINIFRLRDNFIE